MVFHVTLAKAEDGWIVAECPALPGCVSQGKDEQEALANIKEAIAAWLWAEDQKAAAKNAQARRREELSMAVLDARGLRLDAGFIECGIISVRKNQMGHAVKTPPASALEEATEKMLAILEEHVSKFPADKQREKWDGLEAHVKSAASGTRAKRRRAQGCVRQGLRALNARERSYPPASPVFFP